MPNDTLSSAWPLGTGEMAGKVRALDWSGTPLGPSSGWPQSLRTAVELLIETPHAAYLAWGADLTSIYNDGYVPILEGRHADGLGRAYAELWPEIWDEFRPVVEAIWRGEPQYFVDRPVPLADRPGRPMSWFTFSWTPLRDGDGAVAGFFCIATEVTDQVLARVALRESEERFQALVNQAPLGVYLVDSDLVIRNVNPVALPVFGDIPGGPVGRDFADVIHRLWDEDYAKEVVSIFRQTLETGESYVTPERAEHRSDRDIIEYYEWRLDRIRLSGGRYGVVCYFRDISAQVTARKEIETARKLADESEARQAFLLKLSDALRAEPSAEAVANRSLGMLMERMQLDRCYVGIYRLAEDIGEFPHQMHDDCLSPLPAQVRLSDFPEALQVAVDQTLVIDDVMQMEGLSDNDKARFNGLGMRGLISAPLRRSEKSPLWAIVAVSTCPRFWTQGEVSLVEEVAERTWASVERARAEGALQESEARLAAALESVPVGIAVIDPAGKSVLSNAGWRRFLPTGILPSRDPELADRWRAWDAQGQLLTPQDYPGARAMRGERVVPGQEMLYTDEDGREIWTSVASAPIQDHSGTTTGQVVVISDIDGQKRATQALQKSEERLRHFGEASQDILWMRDAATFQWEYLTPAFETVYGLDREAALRGDNMSGWLDLVVPEDRELAAASLARVRDGEWVTFEFRIRRPDGAVRWLRDTDFPITDDTGKVAHIGGIGHDITELKAVEDQLRRSEERLRLAQDAAHVGMWDWDMVADEVSWSDEHFLLEGYAVGEVKPSYEAWLARIHPEDKASADQALLAARHENLPYKDEFRSLHPDGTTLWLSALGRFFYDEGGQAVRMIGTVQDVTERREWQERQQVLVAELQHRTRNLIGVVRSMVDKIGRSSADFPDFRARFRDRLEALARAQGLLSRLGDHDRVTFDELVSSEMAAMNGSADHVTLDGPKGVRLRSSMVQTLAMALHELATNAIKYGALGQPHGRLAITWSVEPQGPGNQPWLHVDWRESGVAMPPFGEKPRGGGQGRELIERALPYQLSAKTTYVLGADGVHCAISIPISTRRPSQEADHG